MNLAITSLFSRLPTQFCLFAFAGVWTLLLPECTHADPLGLRAALVQEDQSRGCTFFSVQGPNFSLSSGVYPAYCSGMRLLSPGETLESSVFLSPGDPVFSLGWEGSGYIDVPENPGRAAILSSTSYIAAYGPFVTVPLDAIGRFRLKVPISITGTLSACLLPDGVVEGERAPCDPNYLDFANVNIAVSGFDVFDFNCGDVDFITLCSYTEAFTGSAVPEPVNMAAIGLAGLAALFVHGRRRSFL